MGVTKALFVNFLVSEIFDLLKVPVRFMVSHLHFSGVAAARLQWHPSVMNVVFSRQLCRFKKNRSIAEWRKLVCQLILVWCHIYAPCKTAPISPVTHICVANPLYEPYSPRGDSKIVPGQDKLTPHSCALTPFGDLEVDVQLIFIFFKNCCISLYNLAGFASDPDVIKSDTASTRNTVKPLI